MPPPALTPAAPPHARFTAPRPPARYPCELPASCQPVAAWLDKESVWPGLISDLSTCGLGLVLGRRFEPGSGLAVELPASAVRCEETLLVRVMKVQPLTGGRWLLSCALISELSEDTVLTLVSQGEGGPPAALPDEQAPADGKQGPALGEFFGRVVARVRQLPRTEFVGRIVARVRQLPRPEFLGRVVARVRRLPPHVGLGIVVLAPLGVGMAVSGIVRLVRWVSGG